MHANVHCLHSVINNLLELDNITRRFKFKTQVKKVQVLCKSMFQNIFSFIVVDSWNALITSRCH